MGKKIKNTIKHISDFLMRNRFTTITGAWVYYFLTSLVPLVFLLITAFSVFNVNLSNELLLTVPDEFKSAVTVVIETAENAHTGVTIFFILTALFSSSALLNQMSKDGDMIYGMKSHHKRGILRRVWAVIAILSLFVLFLGLAFLFAFKNHLFNKFFGEKAQNYLISVFTFSFIISFGYVIIILLNKFISPVKLKFKDICMGSLVSLVVVVMGTLLFTLYLRLFSNLNLFYGSLTAIIVFLLWSYIVMTGIALGVVINKHIYYKHKKLLMNRSPINQL